MSDTKDNIGVDLNAWCNNLSDAGLRNKMLSNDLYIESVRQLLSLSSFYLIFIATLFFFLQKKLDNLIFLFSNNVWLSIAIISGTFSMIFGLAYLFSDQRYLRRGADFYAEHANKIQNYIYQTGSIYAQNIPADLKIERQKIAPWKFVSWLVGFQYLCFTICIILTLVVVIGSIIL